jgi:mannose-1-phosphate guanylyltransferase/mannose-6-phosphate isomerase
MQAVIKPWGYYLILETGQGFQVKRITVKPGGRVSLQSHRHRHEHWTVVKGSGQATVGGDVSTLSVGQSVNIPLGTRHRMENTATFDLEFIEVQFGDYLGEDDITRYEDAYGRA